MNTNVSKDYVDHLYLIYMNRLNFSMNLGNDTSNKLSIHMRDDIYNKNNSSPPIHFSSPLIKQLQKNIQKILSPYILIYLIS